MAEPRDPTQRLRLANPVPQAPGGRAPDELYRRIVSSSPPGGARRRRRRALTIVTVSLSLSMGAATAAVVHDRLSIPELVACYERADLSADVAVIEPGPAGPREACAAHWRVDGPGPAVPLEACLLPSGVTAVFPEHHGADSCQQLGLEAAGHPSNGEGTESAEQFLDFRDSVVGRFLDRPCVEPDQASAIVAEELGRARLEGWTVSAPDRAGEGSSERHCVTLGFQPEQRNVVLVPGPPMPG